MKHRFQPVNTRSDETRCTIREGMATSFAGAVKRATTLLAASTLEGLPQSAHKPANEQLAVAGRAMKAGKTHFRSQV
jgi:hypothetical protein